MNANFMDDIDFIRESNRIEGIVREPTKKEIAEFGRFKELTNVTVAELEKFVSIYQPGAHLRDRVGFNVRVGNYVPPKGGAEVRLELEKILAGAVWYSEKSAYQTHLLYESLHPFTDGNGRSGRMLWAWQMRNHPLGFLHHFYYQTLANIPKR